MLSNHSFSVFTIAILFKYLFDNYPIIIWAFFFGLIFASVIFVGKRVQEWNNIEDTPQKHPQKGGAYLQRMQERIYKLSKNASSHCNCT